LHILCHLIYIFW